MQKITYLIFLTCYFDLLLKFFEIKLFIFLPAQKWQTKIDD